MCIKINKIGKQEVGIWWVQKRFPRYGVPIWSLWPNIRFLPFFSATIDGRDLIFGHKLHIGTPYHGNRFWTHQIPTSCLLIFIYIEHTFRICPFLALPTIWHTYMKLVTKYQISAVNSCWAKCDEKCAYMFNVYKNQQASYRYPISWEAFSDPSYSYFLFVEERGYHSWDLAHSSSYLKWFGLYPCPSKYN
jgi:hypothetical protein